MSMLKLVETEDHTGNFISAWYDRREEAIVVQYNYVHITMSIQQFQNYSGALKSAREKLAEEISSD
ncbi:MAG: hypothetical protein ACLFN5_04785 [bacterium]